MGIRKLPEQGSPGKSRVSFWRELKTQSRGPYLVLLLSGTMEAETSE